MTEVIQPGIIERVEEAVQPLITEGDFQLDTIKYNYREKDVTIILCSPDVDITFHFILTTPREEIFCSFKVKNANKGFIARSLFPACSINIPMDIDDYHFQKRVPNLYMTDMNYQDIHTEYLDKTIYLQRIFQLSTEIKKNLPEILNLFKPEKIDETFRLWVAEEKRQIAYRQKKFTSQELA